MKIAIVIILTLSLIGAYAYEISQLPEGLSASKQAIRILSLNTLRTGTSTKNPTAPDIQQVTSASESTSLAPTISHTPTISLETSFITPESPSPTLDAETNSQTKININSNTSGSTTGTSCYKVTINGETWEECSEGGESLHFDYSN